MNLEAVLGLGGGAQQYDDDDEGEDAFDEMDWDAAVVYDEQVEPSHVEEENVDEGDGEEAGERPITLTVCDEPLSAGGGEARPDGERGDATGLARLLSSQQKRKDKKKQIIEDKLEAYRRKLHRGAVATVHHVHILLSLLAARACDRCLEDPLLQATLLSITSPGAEPSATAKPYKAPKKSAKASPGSAAPTQPPPLRLTEHSPKALTAWFRARIFPEARRGMAGSGGWGCIVGDRLGSNVKPLLSLLIGTGEEEEVDRGQEVPRLHWHLLFVAAARAMGFHARFVCSFQPPPSKPTKAATGTAKASSSPTPAGAGAAGPEKAPASGGRKSNGKRKTKGLPPAVATVVVDLTDDSEAPPGGLLEWAELYDDGEQRWIPIDVVRGLIDPDIDNRPQEFLGEAPPVYVVGFSGRDVRDLTARYAYRNAFEKARYRPIQEMGLSTAWFAEALVAVLPPSPDPDLEARNAREHEQLGARLRKEPLPKSRSKMRGHAMYCVKVDLRVNEAVYPEKPVLGICEGHKVFYRDHVQPLKTIDMWLRFAIQIKEGEEPHRVLIGGVEEGKPGAGKKTKAGKKAKAGDSDGSGAEEEEEGGGGGPQERKELYGRWQTEPYNAPVATGGKVPRTRTRGDRDIIELWCAALLPKGCVHLREAEMEDPAATMKVYKAVCKRLGLDYCSAMTGFERHGGRAVPKIDGIVICREVASTLKDAAREELSRAMDEGLEKKRKAALKRWKELLVCAVVGRQVRNTNYGR